MMCIELQLLFAAQMVLTLLAQYRQTSHFTSLVCLKNVDTKRCMTMKGQFCEHAVGCACTLRPCNLTVLVCKINGENFIHVSAFILCIYTLHNVSLAMAASVLSDDCEQAHAVSTGVSGSSGQDPEPTWVARHPLKLRSAYSEVTGSEPPYTTCHSKFLGTVDYMWYTPNVSTLC